MMNYLKILKNKNILFLSLLVNILNLYNQVLLENTVDHKNFQLNFYLDAIRYNIEEKIGILPYILNNPNGTYLEIGTGGDPILNILENIQQDKKTILIASDIDQNVLDLLLIINPSLNKYINNKNGPCLYLKQLNAINMNIFDNESLDGINASSVLHEIFSYAGGYESIDKFFEESIRVLKPDGILVYRDPEALKNKNEIVTLSLKNKNIRLFFTCFYL